MSFGLKLGMTGPSLFHPKLETHRFFFGSIVDAASTPLRRYLLTDDVYEVYTAVRKSGFGAPSSHPGKMSTFAVEKNLPLLAAASAPRDEGRVIENRMSRVCLSCACVWALHQ